MRVTNLQAKRISKRAKEVRRAIGEIQMAALRLHGEADTAERATEYGTASELRYYAKMIEQAISTDDGECGLESLAKFFEGGK